MFSIDVSKGSGILADHPEKNWEITASLLKSLLDSGYICSISFFRGDYFIEGDYQDKDEVPDSYNYWLTNEEATMIDEKRLQEVSRKDEKDDTF